MNDSETMKETSGNTLKPEKAILLLGDGGVGKTTLAHALTGELFDPNEAVTHGVNVLNVPDFRGVPLVDFSGQAVYEDTISEEIAGRQPIAAMVVADARLSDTVSYVERWCSRLREYEDREDLPKFLVITKCDQRAIVVDEKFLSSNGFTGIYRTSAKHRTGIQELRSAIRTAVVDAEEEQDDDLGEVTRIVRTMADCLCELIARNRRALDEIEWRDLERLLVRAIEELGFTIELTPPAKDGGKDLVATCIVEGERLTYYIEIKHWKKGDRPGRRHVEAFLAVNAREETDGGLFLSSSGFTDEIYACLAEISKQRVRLGTEDKIVSLCQQYVRKKNGLWQSTAPLPELLFEYTLN